MSNITIFKQDGATSTVRKGLSEFAKTLHHGNVSRRIQTNTNGTFRRLVNGEQTGTAVRGEIDVIIIAALPKVSRIFYAEDFDMHKEATLPNCWSNLGDKPEAAVSDKQHTNCAECPKNIAGSGKTEKSRACRFQRRIAVLVEGDPSGEVYQFNIPAKSIFGKGTGNVHPFESYIKYIISSGESPDNVVTTISYDLNAESMELMFTPLRCITDREYELVTEAQEKPETQMYTKITVAQADRVTKRPVAIVAKEEDLIKKILRREEPEDDIEEEPVERPAKKVARPVVQEEEEEIIEEPVKRPSKKAEAPPKVTKNFMDVVDAWSKD